MFSFKLPDLGEGIHEGEILKWHVKEGERVETDAPLVDVETDKAAVTIPAPVGGVVASLHAKVGDVVTVGQELVVIDDGRGAGAEPPAAEVPQAEAPPARSEPRTPPDLKVVRADQEEAESAPAAPSAPQARPPAPPASSAPPARPPAPAASSTPQARPPALARQGESAAPRESASREGGRRPVPAAPATRRLARELGVALREVTATGPGGRVTMNDVRGHALRVRRAEPDGVGEERLDAEVEVATRAAVAIPFLDIEPLPDFSQWGPVERETLRSIRRRVAHKMTTSKILVPHVAHMDEADVTLLEEFRQRERVRRDGQPGGHLTLLAFVIKAVTAGLRATPSFNASLDPFSEEIIYKRYFNIGIAADTGKGLVVPVVKETDRKSILQIARDIEALAQRAREGKLGVEEMRGGTFTITNIGPLGGTALIPAINYPEVAILGMGRVQEKPVVRDGQIVIRKMLPLTLAFDHRIADGADAARFVTEMVRQLSDPNLLLIET